MNERECLKIFKIFNIYILAHPGVNPFGEFHPSGHGISVPEAKKSHHHNLISSFGSQSLDKEFYIIYILKRNSNYHVLTTVEELFCTNKIILQSCQANY